MNTVQTSIDGLLIFQPRVFGDERGFFTETFRKSWLDKAGISCDFIQDNWSRSAEGTLRGLHYQLRKPQAKLVMVTSGEVLDVAVDIRRGSPTFGKCEAILLSEENKRMVFIPEGFAHGFFVKSKSADFMYKCSNYYDPESERSLHWSDPTLGIDWGVEDPLVSHKDANAPFLKDIPESELPLYTRS